MGRVRAHDLLFFFSSRRRHTRSLCDWSSDVCSSDLEAFRCIKVETVPAGSKYSAIKEATGDRLNISAGWAVPQLIEALDRGIHAVTPGGLHWVIVEVVRRYLAGDRPAARALFDRLLPI